MRESDVSKVLVALRNDGYRVKVSHTRRYVSKATGQSYYMDNKSARRMKEDNVTELNPEPTGGVVMVRIEAPGGERVAGFAGCSVRDNFVSLRGTAIALGRAVDQMVLQFEALETLDAQAD